MSIALRVVPTHAEPQPTSLGALLRRLRLRAELSQNRLAREAAVDPAYVNTIELAPPERSRQPSRRVILSLAAALDEAIGGDSNRDRLLAAAGLCPQPIIDAGGWDAYVEGTLERVLAGLEHSLRQTSSTEGG